MFETLTERLTRAVGGLGGVRRLDEDAVRGTLREIRIALLEADVALPVVQQFMREVADKAVGQEVLRSLTPGQTLVKLFFDELVRIMGAESSGLDLRAQPPVVILLAGLQGSGKTTTTAKLARYLAEHLGRKVMVTSCDIYRPAAIDQLRTLAAQVGADFHPPALQQAPAEIAKQAVEQAKRQMCDVLLVDTAGRLHVDTAMMNEIREIHTVTRPHETLFVVDSMTGQDAANTAAAFNSVLSLTGIILTKVDGDARGGAALSVRQVTGKPIKFLGSGEKTDALQVFHPDRVASRILGMGDVLTLVEDVQRKVDHEQADRLARKLRQGAGFDLADLRAQLEQMIQMGGLGGLMEKLPGFSKLPGELKAGVDDRHLRQMIAIINSMTPQERKFPDIIRGSRKKRIALGSGQQIQAVNQVLKRHGQMQKMMKKVGKGGVAQLMKRMGRLQDLMPTGNLPPGNRRKTPF